MLLHGFGAITRTYRHVQRYREIATVLLKHGFGDLVATLELHRLLRLRRWRKHVSTNLPSHPTRDERIRMVFEELGPTFVKLGQILSIRQDVLPDSLVAELRKLQDTVPPFPGVQARGIIERELGQKVETLFGHFDEVPRASGSMAQVHEAITLAGDHVVVKVQRPGIQDVIETDLEIMSHLAGLIEKYVEGAKIFGPLNLVREFSKIIRRELDFTAEANHMERMTRNFSGNSGICIARVFRELTSRQTLTMEYVSGIKISHLAELDEHGLNRETVAVAAIELMCDQIFTHGFYHADPHPGNILVQPGNVLCFLDFGMVGVLPVRYREQLSNLILGLVRRDESQITAAVFHLSGYSRYENRERIEADIANFIEDHLYRPLQDIRMGCVLNELTRILVINDIRMPPDFFILTKALTTIEGVSRMLAPDLDIIHVLEPFAMKLLRHRLSVKTITGQLVAGIGEVQSFLRDLPSDMHEIITMFKRGEVKVKFQPSGLEDFIRTQDQISNRTVFAIVLAALIIGSSLIVLSGIPPKWHEIPIIGVVGFMISGLMGFALLYSIIKHGRM